MIFALPFLRTLSRPQKIACRVAVQTTVPMTCGLSVDLAGRCVNRLPLLQTLQDHAAA